MDGNEDPASIAFAFLHSPCLRPLGEPPFEDLSARVRHGARVEWTDFWQAGGSDTECESDTDVEGERWQPKGAVYRCGMDSDCGTQVRHATLSMTPERRQRRPEASYGLVPAGRADELVQLLPAQWKDTLEVAVALVVFQRVARHSG